MQISRQPNPFVDQYGWGVENTPMDEMRVIEPVRLVGSAFSGSTLDTNFWASGTMGALTTPFGLEMHNIPFANGLTLVISGANCDVLLAYE